MNNKQINEKEQGLLQLLSTGLALRDENRKKLILGDRSSYIGMSDIGKGMECLRAAVLDRINSNDAQGSTQGEQVQNLTQDPVRTYKKLSQQLVLQRGHWVEQGLAEALLAARLNLIQQLEIEICHEGVPIKAHLDFCLIFNGQKPAVRILEIKSNKQIPDMLYTAYETQLYGQLGLLAFAWNKPCFSLRDEHGELVFSRQTMPNAVQLMFGLDLPEDPNQIDIEGWVVSVSMCDIKAFGPYLPSNAMFEACVATAKTIWEVGQSICTQRKDPALLPYCKGFHPLCDWCRHNSNCPKFQGDDAPQLTEDLKKLNQFKDKKAELEVKIKELEGFLKAVYEGTYPGNGDTARNWLNCGEYRFKVSQVEGRKSLNSDLLQTELSNLLPTACNVKNLLARAQKVGQSFSRLYVSSIN